MPLVPHKYGVTNYQPEPLNPVPQPTPEIGELAGAAIRTQNTVYAAADLLTRERYAPDPNFYVTDHLKKN